MLVGTLIENIGQTGRVLVGKQRVAGECSPARDAVEIVPMPAAGSISAAPVVEVIDVLVRTEVVKIVERRHYQRCIDSGIGARQAGQIICSPAAGGATPYVAQVLVRAFIEDIGDPRSTVKVSKEGASAGNRRPGKAGDVVVVPGPLRNGPAPVV